MSILSLALKSLYNRRLTAVLTISSICVSVALLLGVERVRLGARNSFENTISGTDLLVGARTGGVQLLLYSVFRIGNATNNISWKNYKEISKHGEVNWTIPLSLGDSHRGFRVIGTNQDYFRHYRYGQKRTLEFTKGKPFKDLFDAVIGADVAKELDYSVGRKITLAHGISEISFQSHEDKPFVITGILKKTGTPVDRSIHVSLEAIEAIHIDWVDGAPPLPEEAVSIQEARNANLKPKEITAFLVGLKSKFGIFRFQREINEYKEEPLLAILPGATFQELWKTVSVVEKALQIISVFVVFSGLLGMLTSILTTLNERRREIAILRSVGAKTYHIFGLLVSEATLLALLGSLSGLGVLYSALVIAQPIIESQFGLYLPVERPTPYDWTLLGGVVGLATLIGFIPAWRAYKSSLADGLTIRL